MDDRIRIVICGGVDCGGLGGRGEDLVGDCAFQARSAVFTRDAMRRAEDEGFTLTCADEPIVHPASSANPEPAVDLQSTCTACTPRLLSV